MAEPAEIMKVSTVDNGDGRWHITCVFSNGRTVEIWLPMDADMFDILRFTDFLYELAKRAEESPKTA